MPASIRIYPISDEQAERYRKVAKIIYYVTGFTGLESLIGIGAGYLMNHFGGTEVAQLGKEIMNYSGLALATSGFIALQTKLSEPIKIGENAVKKEAKSIDSVINS